MNEVRHQQQSSSSDDLSALPSTRGLASSGYCMTLDDLSMGTEMDLAGRSNPWLPAYGFQMAASSNGGFQQPTLEDLRVNDPMPVQQGDFLETILEETSDDLQSDSDRSGTTSYWLGSDSETESVIHNVKAGQRAADEKQDGSGSECNSVVPKKRRRKNGGGGNNDSNNEAPGGGSGGGTGGGGGGGSSRDSSASSRSSSLLQFESLERTCATLSPSSYSFDSLEYGSQQQQQQQQRGSGLRNGTANNAVVSVAAAASLRSNDASCASPDSLEQDYVQLNGYHRHPDEEEDDEDDHQLGRNGRLGGDRLQLHHQNNGFARLRPYRSFESLDERDLLQTRSEQLQHQQRYQQQQANATGIGLMANGFGQSHAYAKNCDLSRLARRPRSRRRDPWSSLTDADNYSDYSDQQQRDTSSSGNQTSSSSSSSNDGSSSDDEEEEDDEEDDEDYVPPSSRYTEVDQLLVFGDPSATYAHAASLDCRNSVDLRDFGLDSDDERSRTFLDLKSSSTHNSLSSGGHRYSNEDDLDLDDVVEPGVQLRRRHHHHHHRHHHHHHHHHTSQQQQTQQQRRSIGSESSRLSCGSNISGSLANSAHQQQQRHSGGGALGFNFSFTDKWRSAPSLPASLLESTAAAAASAQNLVQRLGVSVPDNLHLRGFLPDSSPESVEVEQVVDDDDDDDEEERQVLEEAEEEDKRQQQEEEEQIEKAIIEAEEAEVEIIALPEHEEVVNEEENTSNTAEKDKDDEMAEVVPMNHDFATMPDDDIEPGKMIGEEKARLRKRAKEQMLQQQSQCSDAGKPLLTSTVKTQDRLESNVREIAIAMENEVDAAVDEAIRQLKRDVEEATTKGSEDAEELRSALENAKQMRHSLKDKRYRAKNNASYELAQQAAVDEKNVDKYRAKNAVSPSRLKLVANNASYELAQQNDWLVGVPIRLPRRQILRMDMVCEEASGSHLKVSQLVEEMSGSACNLASDRKREEAPQTKTYSKSTENVSQQRAPGKQQQPRLEMETSLLGQIKKNSDLFSNPGESSGKLPKNCSSSSSSSNSPRRSDREHVDDEVDSGLLESKPILARDALAEKSNRVIKFEDDVAYLNNNYNNNNNNNKRSFIGDFYTANSADVNTRISKSCEDVVLSRNSSALQQQAGERLWRVVVEKEPSAANSSSPPPSAVRRGRGATRTGEAEAEEVAGVSAYYAHACNAAGSSPAAVACDATTKSRYDHSHGDDGIVAAERQHCDGACASSDDNTVLQRKNEMSATAAKRLAMSGEPTSAQTNLVRSNSLQALGSQQQHQKMASNFKEEKKKGGLGGFLQRFSKLRFSGRSKVPRSEVLKKSASGGDVNHAKVNKSCGSSPVHYDAQQQAANNNRGRNEPDYIIIPLHPPTDEAARREEQQRLQRIHGGGQRNDADRSANNFSANGRPPVAAATSPAAAAAAPVTSKKPPLPPSSTRTSGGGSNYGFGGVTSGSSAGVGAAAAGGGGRRRAATDLGNPAAIEMAKARAAMLGSNGHHHQQDNQQHPRHHHQQQQYHSRNHHDYQRPAGLLETDLDAPSDTEEGGAAGKKARSLLNLNGHQHHHHHHHHQLSGRLLDHDDEDTTSSCGCEDGECDDCCRLNDSATAAANAISSQLNNSFPQQQPRHHHRVGIKTAGAAGADGNGGTHQRPHKSMEFLLDKENLHFVKPPENELQKVGERVPSEHELRVQRSLQRLNVPDWYKNSPAASSGFRLKRHSDASQHAGGAANAAASGGGWRALGSKTTSLSSLSSSSNRQPHQGTLLSPSPTPPVFSRWSTSLLNSAGSSPANSARSSFNHRQPYLGWRSQERLANPRTPAERLAQGLLPQKQQQQQQQQQQSQQNHQQHPASGAPGTTNQEVRNSIKEVTSAIVHYVQSGQEVTAGGGGGGRLSPRPDDWENCRGIGGSGGGGTRSTSPRGEL